MEDATLETVGELTRRLKNMRGCLVKAQQRIVDATNAVAHHEALIADYEAKLATLRTQLEEELKNP